MRTVAAVVWCGVSRLALMHATREDDGHWRWRWLQAAGCLFSKVKTVGSPLSKGPSTKSACKGSVAEAVSNGTHIFYGVSWRSMYRFVSTQ